MLTSFEIKNFRTFKHLRIERLGRVNLILGDNNVGKTTLLEALRLYGSIWPGSTIPAILHDRDELLASQGESTLLDLDSLFHGRSPKMGDSFLLRPLDAEGNDNRILRGTIPQERSGECMEDPVPSGVAPITDRPALDVYHLDREFHFLFGGRFGYRIPSGQRKPPSVRPDPPFLRGMGGSGKRFDPIPSWWDEMVLTASEDRVLEAMGVIASITGIRFVPDPRDKGVRMALVQPGDGQSGRKKPVSLQSLGDGLVRMFQIAVALEFAAVYGREAPEEFKDILPLVLVDEIEAGVHHSLHADLWRFILRVSRELGVQVFATTHSWDCLRGFAEAVAEDEQNDGLAIRLEKVAGEEQTGAVIIDRDDLPIIVRDSIEVR